MRRALTICTAAACVAMAVPVAFAQASEANPFPRLALRAGPKASGFGLQASGKRNS